MILSRILATGDSHAGFWGGRPWYKGEGLLKNIDILPIGGATAYSLTKEGSATKAREKIISHLSKHEGKYDAVLFCFGEVDCRAHIIKQAILQNCKVEIVVKTTVTKYMEFVDYINKRFLCPCIIWGPIASTPPEKFNFNPEIPAVGTVWERNHATMLMNKMLLECCQDRSEFAHISVFDLMLDLDGNTIPSFLFDGCHLSVDYISFGLRLLNKTLVNMLLNPIIEHDRFFSDQPEIVNLAANRPIEQSSFFESTKPKKLTDLPDGDLAFHTNYEEFPWIVIDLLSSFVLEGIEVYTGDGKCQKSTRLLKIEASLDKNTWDLLYQHNNEETDPFDENKKLTVNLNDRRTYRFVRLSLVDKQYFFLQTIRVLGKVFSWSPVQPRR